MSTEIKVRLKLPYILSNWAYIVLILLLFPYIIMFFIGGIAKLEWIFIITPPVLIFYIYESICNITRFCEFSENEIREYNRFNKYLWNKSSYLYSDFDNVYMDLFRGTRLMLKIKNKDEHFFISPFYVNFEKVLFYVNEIIDPKYLHASYILYNKRITPQRLFMKNLIYDICGWVLFGLFVFLIFITIRWYIVR